MKVYELKKIIDSIASKIPNINFICKNSLVELNTDSVTFSAFNSTIQNHRIDELNGTQEYSFVLDYVDLLNDSRTNELDIHNAGDEFFKVLINAIQKATDCEIMNYSTNFYTCKFIQICGCVECNLSIRMPFDIECFDGYDVFDGFVSEDELNNRLGRYSTKNELNALRNDLNGKIEDMPTYDDVADMIEQETEDLVSADEVVEIVEQMLPTINPFHIVTQAEYDAIPMDLTKTLYFIYDGEHQVIDTKVGKEYDGIYFKANAASTMNYIPSTYYRGSQFSLNGSEWLPMDNSIVSLSSGDVLFFKFPEMNRAQSDSDYARFQINGDVSLHGKITNADYQWQYLMLFNGCNGLTDASNFIIDCDEVRGTAFFQMFNNCTNLVKAPKSINFKSKNGNYTFQAMFKGCSKLTESPLLLSNLSDYSSMFQNCSSLTDVYIYAEGDLTINGWLSGVSASGTIHKKSTLTLREASASGIPNGWVAVNDLD